jgi:hypothetical protein
VGNAGDGPSMVGSYSSTKWLWMNWMVRADLPTPGAVCQRGRSGCTGAGRTTAANDDQLVLAEELTL